MNERINIRNYYRSINDERNSGCCCEQCFKEASSSLDVRVN